MYISLSAVIIVKMNSLPKYNQGHLFLSLTVAITIIFLIFLISSAFAYAEPIDSDNIVPGEIIVKLKNGQDINDSGLLAKVDGRVKKGISAGYHSVIKVKAGEELKEIQKLSRDPLVEYAEPNYRVTTGDPRINASSWNISSLGISAFPNDPNYIYQWNHQAVEVPSAWGETAGSGAVVAVVDTGVAYENFGIFIKLPDYSTTTFVPGYNFINGTIHANDDNGHGTHVASIIAESTNNGLSSAGIAYKAAIMPVKVLDSSGNGNSSDVASGVIWAANNGADVINLSLSSPSPSITLKNAIDYARNVKNVVVVAATGNGGTSSIGYPARYAGTIAVGATRYDGKRTSYSQYGTGIDLVAPGGDLRVDQNGAGIPDGILQQTIDSADPSSVGDFLFQGTSMAAPHVSAAAAMLKSIGVSDPDKIYELLTERAKDKGAPGYDLEYGFGLLDAYAALSLFSTTTHWNSGINNWSLESSKVTSGDFDQDGRDDIAVAYNYGGAHTKIWVFIATPSGYSGPILWWDSGPNNWDWDGSKIESGDFDGDGRDDILIVYGYQTTRQTKAWVFKSTGSGFMSPTEWWDSGPNNWDWDGSTPYSGDINGDSVSDLLMTYGYMDDRTVVWRFDSTTNSFTSPEIFWDSGPGQWRKSSSIFTSGDNDADDLVDIQSFYDFGSNNVSLIEIH